ncbi:MAG: leucine-rich repeat domain-containing protein [Lachnospiraceae bacterium]|nr:leucine-rich repeat domain-containing protein [Lachnospiraceae bacterium]
MEKAEMKTKGGVLVYERGEKGISIVKHRGAETVVSIPSLIENLPVSIIGKKAFLSEKTLKKVILPDCIEEIEDWAFARCSDLESITIPENADLGKGLFLECGRLKEIHFTRKNMKMDVQLQESLPFLFAAVPVMLDAEYLFVPEEAGTKQWMQKWDARMLTILRKDDQEGYTKVILCGEEDYGNNPEEFSREKRKGKVRLAFLRLLHPYRLSAEIERELKEYLLNHTKGCETEETWEVLLLEHGEDGAYFRLFTELGCVTEENFQAILSDMKEEHAEMKAFLMRYKEEQIGFRDFFQDMML